MTDRIQVTESLIKPIYSQAHPNEQFDLGTIEVQFQIKGKVYDETARAQMNFVPRNNLEFLVSLEGESPAFPMLCLTDDWHNGKLTFKDHGITVDADCFPVSNGPVELRFTPRSSSLLITSPSQDIVSAKFHLLNFPNFRTPDNYTLLTGQAPNHGVQTCGRVILEADGWTIEIAATDQTADLLKELGLQGGYVISHVGTIAREDKSPFTTEQLDEFLTCLQYFLSFVLGRWAGLAFITGFDSQKGISFQRWGMYQSHRNSWNRLYSLFNADQGQLLSGLFPGFRSLWNQEIWQTPLCHALYWYLGACERSTGTGVDTGLILAQTALEGLAWTYCVQDRKMISPEAFRPSGLKASDKLRLLASSLGIPLPIPPELQDLHKNTAQKWVDGMHAISDVRNALIHADNKKVFSPNPYVDAWRLSLWYIDLVLMRLCNYNGNYSSRLHYQIEKVPWAK